MTTLVSRLFADQETADQAVAALTLQKHPEGNISTVTAGDGAEAAMVDARAPAATAAAYAGAMTAGSVAVIVRAPDTPFGAARNAIETLDEFDAIDAGVDNENLYIPIEQKYDALIDLKVDRTHRYWGSWKFERENYGVGKGRPPSGRNYWGSFLGHPLWGAGKFWGSLFPPLAGAGKHWGSIMPPLTGAGKYWGSLMHPLTGAGKHWGSPFAPPLAAAGTYWGSPTGETILKSHPHMGSFLISPLGMYKESKD